MGQSTTLTPIEEQAFQLSRCAILLDLARQNGLNTGEMTYALDETLQFWVAFKIMAEGGNMPFPQPLKENINKLSDFVTASVFSASEGISDETVWSLININLQISEGLLQANVN